MRGAGPQEKHSVERVKSCVMRCPGKWAVEWGAVLRKTNFTSLTIVPEGPTTQGRLLPVIPRGRIPLMSMAN